MRGEPTEKLSNSILQCLPFPYLGLVVLLNGDGGVFSKPVLFDISGLYNSLPVRENISDNPLVEFKMPPILNNSPTAKSCEKFYVF